jgi:DNA-binding CsgD family transcriptional regulator
MVAGAYRVAEAIMACTFEARSGHEACSYLVDLLPGLLDADAISVELASCFSPSRYRSPEAFFAGQFADPESEALTATLRTKDQAIGRIVIYYTHVSPEMGPHAQAVLDFAAACLSHLLAIGLTTNTRLASLSPAERKVMNLLSLPTKQILDQLGVGQETLRTHIKRISQKLDVRGRREIVRIANENQAFLASNVADSTAVLDR